jgi:hypothetical protein
LNFYKNSWKNENPIIRLACEINGYADEMIVIFHPEATNGFDGYYDLEKFDNVTEAPTLFSIMEDKYYAANFMDNNYIGKIIPVGIFTGDAGTYQIEATEINNFDENTMVYLHDIKNGNSVNLNINPVYEFTYDPDDEYHRFNLFITDDITNVQNFTTEAISVYSHSKNIYVKTPENLSGYVTVYSITGNILIKQNLETSGQTIIPMSTGTGNYLVKVQSDNSFVTRKILLQ